MSDHGNVRRADGYLLRPGLSSNGYLTVSLDRRSRLVQELVLLAFVGPRPAGYVIRHLDGVRTNNLVGNLTYGTFKDNRADADRHGTSVRGERYRTAKLTSMAARVIRRLHHVVPQSELASLFGVSPAAIQAVHDGRTWKHV